MPGGTTHRSNHHHYLLPTVSISHMIASWSPKDPHTRPEFLSHGRVHHMYFINPYQTEHGYPRKGLS